MNAADASGCSAYGSNLAFLDGDEFALVGEHLKHGPCIRHREERISLAPDAIDFGTDAFVHLRQLLAFAPVHGLQEANAASQLFRVVDERLRCEAEELAMDEVFGDKAAAETHGACGNHSGVDAEPENVARKRQRRQQLKQGHPGWGQPRNLCVEQDEVADIDVES